MLTIASNTSKYPLPQLAAKETVTTERSQQLWTLDEGPKDAPNNDCVALQRLYKGTWRRFLSPGRINLNSSNGYS